MRQLLSFLIFFCLISASFGLSYSFPKDDSVITAQLEAVIAADSSLAPLAIKVSTQKSVVTLQGQVRERAEIDRLVALANSIAGVQSVDASGLTVKVKAPPGQARGSALRPQ